MHDLKQLPERGTIEWEAQRVAAAFGVASFTWSFREDRIYWGDTADYIGQSTDGHRVSWVFNGNGRLVNVTISDGEDFARWTQVSDYNGWGAALSFEKGGTDDLMARGCYRMGIEIDDLPPLSAHEKLELRLSLPREFWPDAWVDELEKVG